MMESKQADKECELRLALSDPTNWLSQFFAKEPDKEPDKEELQKLAGGLVAYLEKIGYDTYELDDLFQRMLID